jgi:hypothetical protein
MRSGGPGWEEDDVQRLDLVFAARMPEGRGARDDKEPLLFRILVVVRADRLTRRELVGSEAGAGRAK